MHSRRRFVFHCAVARVALRFMGLMLVVNFAHVVMMFASVFFVEVLGFGVEFFVKDGFGFVFILR